MVQFYCDTGYIRVPDTEVAICQVTGHWSKTVPACLKQGCQVRCNLSLLLSYYNTARYQSLLDHLIKQYKCGILCDVKTVAGRKIAGNSSQQKCSLITCPLFSCYKSNFLEFFICYWCTKCLSCSCLKLEDLF